MGNIASALPPPVKTDMPGLDQWMLKLYTQVNNPAGLVTVTSATYTVGLLDNYIICNRAGTVTLTMPDPKIPRVKPISVRTITANTVVSAASDVIPLAGGAAGTAILAATAGKWASHISDGTNWNIVEAN